MNYSFHKLRSCFWHLMSSQTCGSLFFLMLMMIGFHFVITVDIGDDCRSLELPEKTVHFTKDH